MSTAQQVLKQNFGFDRFRPGQEEVIGHLLSGRSAAAVFPTGAGKSLCYQLPALMLPGVTLVVSPLIALMKDQIDRLKSQGIAAERLDSTLTADENRDVMGALRDGRLRMLYVAPERFNNERFRQAIERVQVSLFAVDKAHCISEWGHNFRPDYLKLARFGKLCRAERLLALTATATPQVLADICRGFEVATECAVRTGFYRPNLTLLVTPVEAARRDALLRERLAERPAGPTIVYVTLQKTAEKVADGLAQAGFPAKAYHAGMENDQRAEVQDWFLASDRAVVVATIAFGMGIDKSNIRYVYHYNLPKSLENFSQEIGRAGRDDEPSTCEMFACPDDLNVLENFVYGDTPSPAAIRSLVGEVFSLGEEFNVSQYELSSAHDIRTLVVHTLLTYLELGGYLEGGTPFYSKYRFQPLAASAQILSRFEGERRDFLANIFRQAEKAKTWFHIDLERAAAALGQPRDRIVRALDFLAEQQLLDVQVEGVRNRFRRLKSPDNLDALAKKLDGHVQRREEREISRLNQVLELAGHNGCLASKLGEHFGEPLKKPCGHCSWCANGRQPAKLLPRPKASIDLAAWQKAQALRAKTGDPLTEPRSLARFLCGVSAPSISRKKPTSDALFGAMSHVPFPEVLSRANEPARGR